MSAQHTPKRWRDIWIDGVQLSAEHAREVELAVNSRGALVEALKDAVAAIEAIRFRSCHADMQKHNEKIVSLTDDALWGARAALSKATRTP